MKASALFGKDLLFSGVINLEITNLFLAFFATFSVSTSPNTVVVVVCCGFSLYIS